MVDVMFKDEHNKEYMTRSQMDTGSTCSAMSIDALAKILHVKPESVNLLPPGGKINCMTIVL